MANKRINELPEVVDTELTNELVLENSVGKTLKAKLNNLLKRLFEYDDVFDDYIVSIHAVNAPSGNTAPTLTLFRDNLYFYAFPTAPGITEGFFAIHIQHDFKPNTDMTMHLHWTHNNATPAGDVKWNVEWTLANGYSEGTFGAPNTASTISAAGAQYAHMITDDADIVIPGQAGEIKPDSILLGRVWRNTSDVQDTFDDDAFLLHVDLHYTKARTGTKEKNAPFTNSGF